MEIPKPKSGRPPKYGFAALQIGGDPLAIPIKSRLRHKEAGNIRSAAHAWANSNDAKLATRVSEEDGAYVISVYRLA